MPNTCARPQAHPSHLKPSATTLSLPKIRSQHKTYAISHRGQAGQISTIARAATAARGRTGVAAKFGFGQLEGYKGSVKPASSSAKPALKDPAGLIQTDRAEVGELLAGQGGFAREAQP